MDTLNAFGREKPRWPRGYTPPRSWGGRSWGLWLPAAVAFGVMIGLLLLSRGLVHRFGTVVVYTSQDEVYAEPILAGFEQTTGLKVQALYDSEAVKTVGLANRLLAERSHPGCDLFWSNEELRMRQLAAADVLRRTNAWAAFGYRSRRLVVNTNRLSLDRAPRSLIELTNREWRGKVALAYPLFGTTATHFLALRQAWGTEPWEAWCRALQANLPLVVDGNSVVVRMVGTGQAWVGLTDSDDIAAGQREGYSIAAAPLGPESLLIPNTVGVVRNCPHPFAAQKLYEYLQRDDVIDRLVAARALEGTNAAGLQPATLRPDWDRLLTELEPATRELKAIFLR